VLIFTVKLAKNNLSTVRIVCDSNESVKFLDKTAVDRHLLSSLPAFEVRMIQIPFTIEYDAKANNTKQATAIRKTLEMSKFVSYNVTSKYTM
jgi:hypothetical protein